VRRIADGRNLLPDDSRRGAVRRRGAEDGARGRAGGHPQRDDSVELRRDPPARSRFRRLSAARGPARAGDAPSSAGVVFRRGVSSLASGHVARVRLEIATSRLPAERGAAAADRQWRASGRVRTPVCPARLRAGARACVSGKGLSPGARRRGRIGRAASPRGRDLPLSRARRVLRAGDRAPARPPAPVSRTRGAGSQEAAAGGGAVSSDPEPGCGDKLADGDGSARERQRPMWKDSRG
jgi:hypothetical protein